MEGKLIKKDGHYDLYLIEEDLPFKTEYKLSLKNCRAIENGYDLDELARQCSIEWNGEHMDGFVGIYKDGFQKALEILGDKKFSEGDMLRAYNQGGNDGASYESACGDHDSYEQMEEAQQESEQSQKEFIQSLQQTEWDVIMEMEYKGFEEDGKLKEAYLPKLDVDGCLILKRK